MNTTKKSRRKIPSPKDESSSHSRRNVTTRRSRKTFQDKIENYKICEITNKRNDVMCDVYHFQCNRAEDSDYVSRLTKIAMKQRHYFYEIFPWKAKCKENWHMFIAMNSGAETSPRSRRRGGITICAWCSVRFEELETRTGERIKAAYIVEVSVRRKREEGAVDENYKGMGIMLLNKIIEYSRTKGILMIYLVPSNESVKGLYKSTPSLQMSEVENTSYLVKSLSTNTDADADAVSLPLMREIITLKREKEREQEEQIYKTGLGELPTRIRDKFIEMIDTETMELDDKIAILGEVQIMVEEEVDEDEIIEELNLLRSNYEL